MKKKGISDPRAMTVLQLLEALHTAQGGERGDAAEELGLREVRSAWRPICRLLKDPYWPNRCSASEALDLLHAREAIPDLRTALKTKNAVVKGYVSETLANLGDAASAPAFQRMKKSRSSRIRLGGAAALYILGDDRQIKDVIRFLATSDFQNQCASSNLLSRIVRRAQVAQAKKGLSEAIRTSKNPARVADFTRTLRELDRR